MRFWPPFFNHCEMRAFSRCVVARPLCCGAVSAALATIGVTPAGLAAQADVARDTSAATNPASVNASRKASDAANRLPRKPVNARGNPGQPGAKESTVSHSGRPPKQPAASLPAGAPRPEQNMEVRRTIAGGPTDDEKFSPLDAEMQVLKEAERVLFPRPLPGVRPGWSWDDGNAFTNGDGPPGDFVLPPEVSVPGGRPRMESVGKWLGELTLPNLPVRFEPNVVTYLQFYRVNTQGKGILRTWAKKSGRYYKVVTAEFAKAGLPTDLVWQSVIESSHNATAKSAAGALGLWQFMPDTARAYGLAVDRWVDERLDPQRSSEAAAKLLADLHRRFGNWELAMAAYNMGYAGLGRAIRKYNSNDYWLLCRLEGGLPWETTLYVPKVESLAIAMNNRTVFGIDDVEPEAPVPTDLVSVGPGVSLSNIAKAAGVSELDIGQLNPQFIAGRTPPAAPSQSATISYAIRVPAGTGNIVARKTTSLPPADSLWDTYVIKQGDTLDSIARSTNQSVADLRALNQIGASEILMPGDLLLVAKRDRPLDVNVAEDERVVVVSRAAKTPSGMRRIFYRVVTGDTLTSIARAFELSRSDLIDWNSIDTSARLQAKMVLTLFVPEQQVLSKVRYLSDSDARVLLAGSQEFAEYFEGLRGNDRVVVKARTGDTLASIASRYHVNVATLERVNRKGRTSRLAESDDVVLYAPHGKIPKASKSTTEAIRADGVQQAVPTRGRVLTAVPERARTNSTANPPDAG